MKKKTLIIGSQGSGKTTKAKELVDNSGLNCHFLLSHSVRYLFDVPRKRDAEILIIDEIRSVPELEIALDYVDKVNLPAIFIMQADYYSFDSTSLPWAVEKRLDQIIDLKDGK
ncbi:hypothetical protein FAZ19_19805 [Sphingobacterium alkalisoli]|uniref:AAA family ATPase n=1 Tax=Sphingobacterium alkalisoli TaxID=1874115 RepID=A0A4U0GUY0_9SPHI|nr:hypothetical protein [Sphingobacterium alkalisoli]TJY62716.1 hypothetical protein FAZ19_19805 [Sphingobacterium alkalisoli]